MTNTAFRNSAIILLALLAALSAVGPGATAFAAPSSAPHSQTWMTDSGVHSIVATPTTVYIGGEFTNLYPNPYGTWIGRAALAAIDAVTGQATDWNPGANGFVNSLVISGTTLYAGGDFTIIGGQPRNRIAAFDLTTGLVTDWNPGVDQSVSYLAISDSTVYVAGGFNKIGGQWRHCIAALDAVTGLATDWDPYSDDLVNVLAVSGTTVYAGGYFTTIGGQPRTRIAALDATTGQATAWNPDSDSAVNSLALSGTTVYAGGFFTSIGGKARNRIAALDATTGLARDWDANVTGAEVDCVAVSGTTVYVGGDFSAIGGQPRNYMAALETVTGVATAWNPNADYQNSTFAFSGTTVYAGGGFGFIGGQLRNCFAEFRDPATDTTAPTGTIVINNNRSATKSANVTLTLTWDDFGDGSGVSRMRFSDDGTHWTAWGALASPYPYTLPVGDGYKTVRVQYLDKKNNRSATFSDYIRLDSSAPTGSIIINNGASSTKTRDVTLNLTWADTGTGVTRMRFSDNGSTWTGWQALEAAHAHTLPEGLGYHTVRVQYTDGADNYSPVYNDYIKLVSP